LRVLIAGGGTGGHVMPGLAIARELRDVHGAEVRFVGTVRGLETKLVPEAGFALNLIPVGQLNRVSLKTRVRTVALLPQGLWRCMRLLRSFRPHVVVGVGGYASGPAMLAAILLRIPTLAYEPNAVPGFTNRMIGRRVNAAAVNFADTASFFHNAVVTGVPVRAEIFALIFNQTMPAIAARLLDRVPGLTIVHQAGARHVETTTTAYAASGADSARWQVEAFLLDMPVQYGAADVVLARSGSTVAELAAAGKPSVLVPLPTAADDHQTKNAEILARAGAAVLLAQADVTPESMLRTLVELLMDEPKRRAMSIKARALSRAGSVERIGTMVVALAGSFT
jgi:UDP-N-acetylglucosamine--N-acetylmuramyl-(pentapeptide) pyrophosphoryl-undecaprenol N-acetylglucosamine transferase